MRRIGDILEELFDDPRQRERLKEAKTLAVWEMAVGEPISRYAHAVALRNGILLVRVDHPTWRQELFFRKKEILQRLHRFLSKETVKDIKFK